jgi:hypothetical protein
MQKVVKFRNWISLSETFEWVDSLMETIKLFFYLLSSSSQYHSSLLDWKMILMKRKTNQVETI